ncbi:hypothetical protein UFOVP141_47 [uncultured Caudovirales phage]|uniref:Holliday junction resolvase n=1 Tax=uncultured Caudovirales phage TaxID=2100421 RepID=A0A6J7VT67_9CAUD|nr:hypothetical protein UFOVP141_47 [uncultured Caudovirales phage]
MRRQTSAQARMRQRRGAVGQEAALFHLQALGVRGLQEIATPIITKQVGRFRVVVGYRKKVCGDILGRLPGGRSVLVEVKSCEAPKLPWNELQPHQRAHLLEHAKDGGLALVAWHYRFAPMARNVAIFPVDAAPGWSNGHPLPWETALALSVTREQLCRA